VQRSELAIILPTRNERRNTRAFLSSLPEDVPLIVVDSSDDETPDIIRSTRPRQTLVIERPCDVVVARQIGTEAAHAPWLLFTDADVTFAPDYFERLTQLDTDDPRLGAIYGPKLSRDRFQGYYRWFTRGQRLFATFGIPAATGSNLIIRRSVLQAIGGFDLTLTCNEDSEIAWRIQPRGYRTRFVPDIVVYARDHRRLERGVTRKVIHSSLRCFLLYFNLLPSRWRGWDWGYWSPPAQQPHAGPPQSRMR
jgi:cellulose synthase/poly-beta-1,6-N-acetylglucosamine synthase-like glycosyltransferase